MVKGLEVIAASGQPREKLLFNISTELFDDQALPPTTASGSRESPDQHSSEFKTISVANKLSADNDSAK